MKHTPLLAAGLALLLAGPALAQTPARKTPMHPTTAAPEYQSPTKPVEHGKAPGLRYQLLSEQGGVKNYVLVFAKGDEVLSGLTDFAAAQGIQSAHFSAIGAFSRATTAWFDPQRKQYLLHRIQGPVELVSLLGDVALQDGKPAVHSHLAVGYPDGRLEGGHLIEAYVFPTVELYLTVYATPVSKKADPETDLHLMDLPPAAGQ